MNHSWSFPLRATKASAVGIAFLVLLAGCGGSGGAEQPSASPSAAATPSSSAGAEPSSSASASDSAAASASASAEYKPATAEGPAENVPVPEMPAVAKEHTKEGYEAFVRYWVDLVNYSNEARSYEQANEITNSKCATCQNIFNDIDINKREDRWMVGGGLRPELVYTDMIEDTQGFINGQMNFRQDAGVIYSEADGKVDSFESSGKLNWQIVLKPDETGWLVVTVGIAEGSQP